MPSLRATLADPASVRPAKHVRSSRKNAFAGLVHVAAFRRAPAGCFRRNLGRRGGGGARGGGWWGKARAEMSPTNRFRLYAGHRSGKGKTREYAGWGRDFAAPPKFFCGPGRDAGFDRAGFSAPTRILAVIFRVEAGCKVC